MRADILQSGSLGPAEQLCLEAIKGAPRSKTAIALRSRMDLRRTAMALDLLVAADLVVSTGRQSWQLTPLGQQLAGGDPTLEAAHRTLATRDRAPRPGSTGQRLLDMLDRPRRGGELAKSLGVTRQRVHQLIVKLSALDLVRLGDPDHPMHVVASKAETALLLNIEEERLLSAFPASGRTTLGKIRAAAGMTPEEVERWAPHLTRKQLIEAGGPEDGETLYGLTPAGSAHWQRAEDARHAELPALPVRSDRVRAVLAYFDENGPTRTIQVGRALGISRDSINALMQYLKRKRLVRKGGEALNAPHELTASGKATLRRMQGDSDEG